MSFTIYRTKSSLSIRHGEIHSLEVNYGCDGERHALCITKVYMDEDGKPINGEHVGDVIVGECDGSCKEVESLGGFVLASEISKVAFEASQDPLGVEAIPEGFCREFKKGI